MIGHIYSIGQCVNLSAKAGIHLNPRGIYTVTRLLPPLGAEFQYRIRSEPEAHERVVVEHQIKAVEPTKTNAAAQTQLTRDSEIARVFAEAVMTNRIDHLCQSTPDQNFTVSTGIDTSTL